MRISFKYIKLRFTIFVVVINSDKGTAEGEYLAESNEYAVVYFAYGWYHEARHE